MRGDICLLLLLPSFAVSHPIHSFNSSERVSYLFSVSSTSLRLRCHLILYKYIPHFNPNTRVREHQHRPHYYDERPTRWICTSSGAIFSRININNTSSQLISRRFGSVGVYALILPRQYLAAGDLSPSDRIYEIYHYIAHWQTGVHFSSSRMEFIFTFVERIVAGASASTEIQIRIGFVHSRCTKHLQWIMNKWWWFDGFAGTAFRRFCHCANWKLKPAIVCDGYRELPMITFPRVHRISRAFVCYNWKSLATQWTSRGTVQSHRSAFVAMGCHYNAMCAVCALNADWLIFANTKYVEWIAFALEMYAGDIGSTQSMASIVSKSSRYFPFTKHLHQKSVSCVFCHFFDSRHEMKCRKMHHHRNAQFTEGEENSRIKETANMKHQRI